MNTASRNESTKNHRHRGGRRGDAPRRRARTIRSIFLAGGLVGAALAFALVPAHADVQPALRLLTTTEEQAITARREADSVRTVARLQAIETRDAVMRKANPDLPARKPAGPGALPAKFTWEDREKVTPVKNQGSAGTCWTFAEVGVIESELVLRDGVEYDLAEQDLIDCGRSGAAARIQLGVSYESENPYKRVDAPQDPSPACKTNRTPFYVEGPVSLALPNPSNKFPSDPVATPIIKKAIYEHGPVVVNMHLPKGSGFFHLSGKTAFQETIPLIYDNNPKQGDKRNNGSHIVAIVDWDDSLGAWRIKNSWGTGWADHGFGYIKYGSNRIGMGAAYYVLGAPEVLVSAIWDKTNAEEVHVDAWPYAYFQSKYDELWKNGWRISQLATAFSEGRVLYSASWRRGNDAEIQYYGLKYADFKAKYDAIWKDGWRLFLLDNYVEGGEVRYSAVWRKTGGAEIQWFEQTYPEFQKNYDDLWKKGYRLEILSNVIKNGQVLYTGVFRPSNAAEIQWYGQNYTEFQKKYDALWKDGWRIHLLQNYWQDGKLLFNATWRKGQSGEMQWYGLDANAFGAKSQELAADGWRIRLLDAY
jgi:C1A family cysteine protease